MTVEEFENTTFRFVSHASMKDEHTTTYASEDGRLGWCEHVPYKDERPKGRTYTHWRIGSKIYKTKAAFLKSLEEYKPK
jgi:hypothetical protein